MKQEQDGILTSNFIAAMRDAIVVVDEKYNIIACNAAAVKNYGFSEAELLAKNIVDLFAPENRAETNKLLQQAVSENDFVWQASHMRNDQTKFPVEITVTPVIDNNKTRLYLVLRDITQRNNSEQALLTAEQRYRRIVEILPDTIIIHRESKILFVNPAGLKLFAANNYEQIIGKSFWDLYPSDSHGLVRAHTESIMQSNAVVPITEHRMLRLDGKTIHVEGLSCLIDYDGHDAIYLLIRDISERKLTNIYVEMQSEVTRSLTENTHLSESAAKVIEIICNAIKADAGKIWAYDKDEKILRSVAAWNSDKSVDKIHEKIRHQVTLHSGEGFAGKILSSNAVVWVDNPIDLVDVQNTETQYVQAIGIPIISGKDLIGVMELMSKHAISKDHKLQEALLGVCTQIGAYINRKQYEKKISFLSMHDPVTGLPNRTAFEDTLALNLSIAKNKEQRIALLFLDIDAFSPINEAMGHAAGDLLLKEVATRLLRLVVDQDSVARFGGDQFGIMLINVEKIEDVTNFVDTIKAAMIEPFLVQDQKVTLTIGVGVGLYPDDSDDVQSLMRSADIALTGSKDSGRGGLQFCTVDMNNNASKRLQMEHNMRQALDNNEFVLMFQPIVQAPEMHVKGFESLLRWKHKGKMMSPGDFIPMAEDTQLIVPIGEWIIREACKQAKIWQTTATQDLFVSINISPIQFKHAKVIDSLSNIITEVGLNPKFIKVEITETAVMEDIQKSIKTLGKIKDMGIQVAIDDFGTGYSSLNYLRHLPVDYIKIDQAFVRTMTTNANDAAIVKTIVNLANNLGFKMIAEGVETQEQLDALNALGCHVIQGYFFSRPLLETEASILINTGHLA